MTPPFITPSDYILRAIKRTLQAFDWIGAGLTAAPHIRHGRRRFTQPDEYPCITIRWEKDEPRDSSQDDRYITADEMYVDMLLTLEVDVRPNEPDPDEDPDEPEADDADDETGLGFPSALAFLSLRALKDPEGELRRLWANEVSDRGRGEDPDSTPDEARFDQSTSVLYRVSTADPSVILAEGMNL